MKTLIFALALVAALVGCKHDNIDSDWQKIELPNSYSYYVYESAVPSDDLYMVFTGHTGGYDTEMGSWLKDYLKRKSKGGTIILPYMQYKDPAEAAWTLKCAEELAKSIKHDRLFLIGYSAGAGVILQFSNDIDYTTKLLSTGAGAYQKWGGKPTDEFQAPTTSDGEWYVAGYDVDTYVKYGVKFDGSVYIEPVIRLADETGAKITVIPDADHSDVKHILKQTDQFFDWLSE